MKAFPSKKRKRLPVFWLVMLALVIVNTAVIGVLLTRLRLALAAYEASTPGAALRGYLDAVRQNDFTDILADSGFVPSPLNGWPDYTAMLTERLGSVEAPQLRKTSAAARDGWEQYMLLDGDKEAAMVWLSPAPEGSVRGWRVRCEYEYLPGYTVTVPEHLEVYVGGRRLGEENARIEQVPIPVFGTLPEEARPARLRYITEPTLYEQEIRVRLPEGNCVLGPEPGRSDPRCLEGWEALPPEQEQELSALIERAAKAYAAFVTNDAEFAELAPFLLPDTPFYSGVRSFDRRWYAPHDGSGYENLNIHSITMWSRDAFSGKISFDYQVYTGRKAHTYPTSYHMAFLRSKDGWKLAHIQVQ